MIRVVAFLVLASLLALGVVWLADRPGDVTITWLGYRIDTSVMVMVGAAAALAIAAVIFWSIVRSLLRSPKLFSLAMRERKRRKGYDAISRGLVAVGAGDARAALRFAGNADKTAASEPLALLLRAQTAQLLGDRAAAEEAFRAMAERGDTRLLGLRGLFVEAQRRNDHAAAYLFADQANKAAPALPWAGQALLEFRCAGGDWPGALGVLEANRRSGVLDRRTYQRQRAVLLTARAMAEEEGNRDAARAAAVEAVKLAPDLVPAAALAGRLLSETGEHRKAGRIVEAAWRASPHPDLADTYAHLRISDSARDRLARVQRLVREPAGHAEGALALARAALDARELVTARKALDRLAEQPTQRVALLMAELEQLDGDEGRAREWMGRALRAARDPAWSADGIVSDRWMPVSPVTGRLDAFQWKVPVAELGSRAAEPAPVLIDATPREDIRSREDIAPREEPHEEPREVVSPPLSAGPAGPFNGSRPPLRPRPAATPAPIIPLSHVPDDPGPEPEGPLDAEPRAAPWQRFRQLFR